MLTIFVCHPDPMPNDEEVRLGVSAAERVFKEVGVSALDAKNEAESSAYDEESTFSQTWFDAEREALTACFALWRHIPQSAHLDYR